MQIFSYETPEICQNSWFAEHLKIAAFENSLKEENFQE